MRTDCGKFANGWHTRGLRAAHPTRDIETNIELVNVKDKDRLDDNFPLSKREGDCDDDADCVV